MTDETVRRSRGKDRVKDIHTMKESEGQRTKAIGKLGGHTSQLTLAGFRKGTKGAEGDRCRQTAEEE